MIKNFINREKYEYYEEASLKRYNTYRVNAICSLLILPDSIDKLIKLINYLKKKEIKYIILGNGSNIILSKEYYEEVFIVLSKLNKKNVYGEIIEVEAGYMLPKLALDAASLNLSGLEFASGIPGMIGASVSMNAGAYNHAIEDIIIDAKVLNASGEIITMTKEDLCYEYRSSILKNNHDYTVISARIKLTKGNRQEIMEICSKRRVKRIETQPLDMPSAGSVFRNPEGMHAGALIEQCGLKGYSIGGACVSEKHANFIVNIGGATGKDIIALIEKVKYEVKQKYNVELILEQIII